MIKKIFKTLTIITMVILCAGCGQKQTRTVQYEEMGLEFEAPSAWGKYEGKNLYVETLASQYILCEIKYSYLPTEHIDDLNSPSESLADNDALKPICEIILLKLSDIETDYVKNLFSNYDSIEEISVNGEYVYYLLSQYNGDLGSLSDADKSSYIEMVSAVSELKDTIKISSFDEEYLKEQVNKYNNVISFSTETLDGGKIDSSVFAGYDLTMVSFGGTYAYDETSQLQILYDDLLKSDYNVNLITAYIDTPDESTNDYAKELRSNTSFTTIVLDLNLANWVTKNLSGVPSTIFVDSDGYIVGDIIEGAKSADEYKNLIVGTLTLLES